MTLYHILSRGVDKRKIFLDDEDYLRGIHDLFEFNDTASVTNSVYFFRKQEKSIDVRRPYVWFVVGQGLKKLLFFSVRQWMFVF